MSQVVAIRSRTQGRQAHPFHIIDIVAPDMAKQRKEPGHWHKRYWLTSPRIFQLNQQLPLLLRKLTH